MKGSERYGARKKTAHELKHIICKHGRGNVVAWRCMVASGTGH